MANFGALLKSIIGNFKSTIGSGLAHSSRLILLDVLTVLYTYWSPSSLSTGSH